MHGRVNQLHPQRHTTPTCHVPCRLAAVCLSVAMCLPWRLLPCRAVLPFPRSVSASTARKCYQWTAAAAAGGL